MQSDMQQTNSKPGQSSLFDLGWLYRHPAVSLPLVRELARKAEAYRNKLIGEASTISIFVEPLLRGLGWDTLDIEQVGHESRRRQQVGDIHLLVPSSASARSLRVLLECKDLDCRDRDLDRKPLRKLTSDVNDRLLQGHNEYNEKVRPTPVDGWLLRGVLTNGRLWLLYDFSPDPAKVSTRHDIGRFELSESLGHQELADFTKLLCREAILRRARG